MVTYNFKLYKYPVINIYFSVNNEQGLMVNSFISSWVAIDPPTAFNSFVKSVNYFEKGDFGE